MRPFISIVIPAYNEAVRIGCTMDRCAAFLSGCYPSWELLVVDDGSTDRTAEIVAEAGRREPRIRLIRSEHAGKGAAVRRGMLQANGDWCFLADADLSMDITQLPRFFEEANGHPPADVVIGSREAPGARRIGEPWQRHAVGRMFNWLARLVAVPGIQDTQCGFKLFSHDAAIALFAHQSLDGFAFDVEILFLARRAGLSIRQIPVTWEYVAGGAVRMANGFAGFAGVLRVRLNQLRGRYRAVPRAIARPL